MTCVRKFTQQLIHSIPPDRPEIYTQQHSQKENKQINREHKNSSGVLWWSPALNTPHPKYFLFFTFKAIVCMFINIGKDIRSPKPISASG